MGSNHAAAGNWQTGSRAQSKSLQRRDYGADNDLEDRIKHLGNLVDSLHTTPTDQMSFSGEPRALDLVTDLRVKIKASHDLLRVAKLLSDPARESMFSKIRDSLNELEESIASHSGVTTRQHDLASSSRCYVPGIAPAGRHFSGRFGHDILRRPTDRECSNASFARDALLAL